MDKNELKPCPFCGYEHPSLTWSNGGRCFYISCENRDIYFRLGAGAKERIESRIIEAWNKRDNNFED